MSFTKTLTMSDIESKLVVPNDMFRDLFSPTSTNGSFGGEAANFFVRNQNGLTWTFRLSCIRAHGSSRYKLVVSAGWLSFVRDRKLQIGDRVSIFKERGNYCFGDRTSFRIEVTRPLAKSDQVHGPDNQWLRLV